MCLKAPSAIVDECWIEFQSDTEKIVEAGGGMGPSCRRGIFLIEYGIRVGRLPDEIPY